MLYSWQKTQSIARVRGSKGEQQSWSEVPEGGRTLGNDNKHQTPPLTRNFLKRRLFRRTAKMNRQEVIPWDNVWRKKRTLGPGVWRRDNTKTILKPARANKVGMGNNIFLYLTLKLWLKSQKGHGISKHYTMEQENRSREADIGVSGIILGRKGLKSQQWKNQERHPGVGKSWMDWKQLEGVKSEQHCPREICCILYL